MMPPSLSVYRLASTCIGYALLAGCASTQPAPVVVKVPVAVPCVDLPLPERPTKLAFGAGLTGRPYPGHRAAIIAAERDWSAWETYANDLEAAYSGCLAVQPEKAK